MNDAVAHNELVLLPSLRACRGPNGGLVLTRKFLNGVAEYARYWPGRVTALVQMADQLSSDMDHVEVGEGDGFGLEVRPTGDAEETRRIARASVVLAFLSPHEARMVQLSRRAGVPLVYSSEYSLRTELQIIRATVRNPLRRVRKYVWTGFAEKKRLDALRYAAGIQCSGTPTYEVYKRVNANALLFFDNRVTETNVIAEEAMEAKLATLRRERPLRLVFGGRLTAMKGVMDLPRIAHTLQRRGVSFTLDVYGKGELEGALQQAIDARGLGAVMHLRGAMEFETGWIPMLKSDADLFVCCHPQGDPSSTYPEVMSCGVAIAGYDNDAFKGVVEHSGSGWVVKTGDTMAMAKCIERLSQDRGSIADHARKARTFALRHAFERTFRARTEHLMRASRLPVA